MLTVLSIVAAALYVYGWNYRGWEDWRKCLKLVPAGLMTMNSIIKGSNVYSSFGIFLCCIGDYILLPNPVSQNDLISGIGVFGLAHICFILSVTVSVKQSVSEKLIDYLQSFISTHPFGKIELTLLLVWITYCMIFISAARKKSLSPIIIGAVCGYGALIIYLVKCSLHYTLSSHNHIISIGVILFASSDALLSWNLLIYPFYGGDVVAISLYWSALVLIGNSFV